MSVPPPGPPGPPPGEPQWGQPQWGQPQQPQWGQPQYGQPQYGQPQYGQPQYGQPQQPQYGQPPQWGHTGHGPPPYPPPKSSRTPIIVAIALVVLVGVGLTLFFVLRGSDDSSTKAAGPSGSATATGNAPRGSASSAVTSSDAGGSSTGPDTTQLKAAVTTLYSGLTAAYIESAKKSDPAPVGDYIAAHNNSSLGYTATQCNATTTELKDPIAFEPNLPTLVRDASFTEVVNGRYAGRPVVGVAYSLTLTTRSSHGQTASSRVHVAVGTDDSLTFFFECES